MAAASGSFQGLVWCLRTQPVAIRKISAALIPTPDRNLVPGQRPRRIGPTPRLRQPKLLGAVGHVHSFDYLISDDPVEWLNGRQLRCAAAVGMDGLQIDHDSSGAPASLGLKIKGRKARELNVFDPCTASPGESNVVATFLASGRAKAILGSRKATHDAIAIQFCEDRHWRFLALVGAERTLYYWNPYGSDLEAGHALRTAVMAYKGWRLVPILHQLQSDNFQCAPWTHMALRLFVAYFQAGEFGGFDESFAKHDKLRPLNLLEERSRQATQRATAVNSAFIQGVRDDMRQQLRDADARGTVPFSACAALAPASPRTRLRLQAQGGSTEDNIVLSDSD